MGRNRYDWFGMVQRMCRLYPKLKKRNSIQCGIYEYGIEKAIEETQKMQDGDARLKLMTMVYFNNTHTIDGAAYKLHISTRTAVRWQSDFIYKVGKYTGWMN